MAENTGTLTDEETLAHLRTVYDAVQAGRVAPVAYADAVAAIDWRARSPEWFRQAIQMALDLDAVIPARELARFGHQLYRGDDDLKRAATILAPPEVLATDKAPKPGLSASMTWFREHAGEHRGQWIAVRAGELLGTASSRPILIDALNEDANLSDVLITWIP